MEATLKDAPQSAQPRHAGGITRLRFLAIDPQTEGDHCPAMQVDEETGDLAFVGETITDGSDLAQLRATSGISPSESGVRIPRRMRRLILEKLRELEAEDPTVP